MAIVPIRKIHVLAHRSEKNGLVAALQKLGVMEICRSSLVPGTAGERDEVRALESRLDRVEKALVLLRPFSPRITVSEKLYPPRPAYREGDLLRIVDTFDLDGFLAACEGNSRRLDDLHVGLARLEEERRQLSPWASLDLPPPLLHSTARVEIRTGRLPLRRRQLLLEKLEGIGAFMEAVSEDDRHVHAVVLCRRSSLREVEYAMTENAFQPLKLPGIAEEPSRRLALIKEERLQTESEIARLREKYRLLAKHRGELLVLRDLLTNHLDRLRAEEMMAFTRETFSLEGWIPADRLPGIREHLLGRFPLSSISDSDPGPLDRPPVILDNGGAVRPFGLVLDLYGLPRYGSVDPSSVLAAFFALFFGLCLTDAGYGLLLAAVTGALLHAAPRPLPPGPARFFKMLFLCALATVAAGAAAGGWFGLEAPWRLFDPLDDLMLFFLLALAAGTAHIFAGLILRMARVVRAGDILGAAVDQGLWMVLVLALFGVAAGSSGHGPAWLPALCRVFAVLSALGIVFFQGRPGDGSGEWRHHLLWGGAALACGAWLLGAGRPWSGLAALALLAVELALLRWSLRSLLARIGLGLYALYGITGYLSDILSYSRLVALGLATGIVALVVNKMAAVALGTPGIGVLLAGAVLVTGHLFNVLINLLGAFVHSCRLQYVEFFTKFYESGGRPFRPFRMKNRYITLEEQA